VCLLSQVEWEKRFYSASLDTLGNLIYKKPYKGNVLDFYYDGNIKTKGQYVNGLMSGMWTYYYPNGVIKAKGRFFKGDGGDIHATSGIPQNGRYGEWTIYYLNGNINAKYQYINGEFDQNNLEWYANGQKKYDYSYIKGIKDGGWNAWYKNGQKKHHYFYNRGKKVKTWIV